MKQSPLIEAGLSFSTRRRLLQAIAYRSDVVFDYFCFMERGGCIYIMTNQHHTTLYIGVTSNLPARIREHKYKAHPKSFTARYNLEKLVYYEVFGSIEEAIAREKQIKGGSRKKKETLINAFNPKWKDLYEEVMEW